MVLACSGPEANPDESTVELLSLSASLAGETAGLSTPESVRYDRDLDVFFISSIDGRPAQKDGKGFIVVVPADSLGVMRRFASGGDGGVTLHAPMGMALSGDTLWVVDVDAVRGFHRRTGVPVATIDLSSHGPTLLNDIAVGPNGALYLTDTGVRFGDDGSIAQRGEGRIFRITNRVVTEVARGAWLGSPNGITWQDTTGVWLLAPLDGTNVLTWVEGDSITQVFATGSGVYDGIEALSDGRVLVTSWADSAVHLITHGTMTRLIRNVNAPADLGYDMKRGVIAVPRYLDGKVEYYQLAAERR
jgi:hypothetical protein